MAMQWYTQPNVFDSLSENVWPPSPDKVPRQRLSNHIVSYVDDGGGGILLSDQGGIQSVL